MDAIATLRLAPLDAFGGIDDRSRLLQPLVTIMIGRNQTEQILFSAIRRFIRVDLVDGTLIGCPSSLAYLLRGLTRLRDRSPRSNALHGWSASATSRARQLGSMRVTGAGFLIRRWRTYSRRFMREVKSLSG